LFIKRFISLVNNQKPGYEADGDLSDSNSIPSVSSDKDLKVKRFMRKIFA
jgi:hypothetical protein